MSEAKRTIRCAIYTRKSSEEGLEQEFNSLDAQYEACSAYIVSQKSEGWKRTPVRYDDGGISGGTLERPALRRLLADIEAGRIDLVVVYKIDRLTRSLMDFSKLVERFDKSNCSFVSVTQAFNTCTSMGRLTLNVLLSFAQFEREVTAERIRDKIAASKKKGMWMGGIDRTTLSMCAMPRCPMMSLPPIFFMLASASHPSVPSWFRATRINPKSLSRLFLDGYRLSLCIVLHMPTHPKTAGTQAVSVSTRLAIRRSALQSSRPHEPDNSRESRS